MEELAGRPKLDNALVRLRRELENSPYHHLLGLEAVGTDAAIGSVTLCLPMRPEFRRAADDCFVHGGIIAALIDITGHAAVAVRIEHMAPTIDLRIDYLRPAGGSRLTATATLLRCGRSVARVDIEVSDSDGCIVAVGRGSFSTLDPQEHRGQDWSSSKR
jgi:uncharacterized protein (TIGR00369 family)